jgi:hypothetical protein
MEENKKDFINKNSYWIYTYINSEILQGIAIMHPEYFVKIIEDIFEEKKDIKISEQNLNILPYLIFTLISEKGKLDYTSLRADTIDFTQIDKEASVYYNYVQFSLKDDFFYIELMQTKIGGMPIDKDIVKFLKKIPIKKYGLEEFISNNNKKI